MIPLQYTLVHTTFVGRSMKQIRLFKRNPSVQAFKEIYPSLTPRKGKIPNWVAQTIRLHLRTKKSVSKHYICQPRWRGSVLIITLFLPFLLQLTLMPSFSMKILSINNFTTKIASKLLI